MAVTVNGGAPSAPQIAEFQSVFQLTPVAHVASGGAAHADVVAAGASGFMTGADKTKLNGIATGATANSADATLLARANHTGTQAASTISDFNSASRAQTEAELIAGANITITPASSGATRTLTIAATGGAGATNLGYTAATRVLTSDTGTDVTLPLVSSGDAGLAPASGGGTSNFLRADGSWAAPPGGTVADGSITLAKLANLAQDQFIGRTTASTGVPQTATITAAARTVLDDTTVAAMVDTLGGAASTGTGGIARAVSPAFTGTPTAPTAAVSTNTTQVATTAFVRGEISNISGTITTAKTSFANADKALALDSASSDAPVTITGAVIRTIPVGTSLGTTGSVALDFATLVGTRQSITATGNITFTTSNLAAGRGLELRIGAGGSTRTLTWPAWVAFGAALPTSLASGATLIVSLFANSTTDASVDAVAVVSA